MNHALRYAGACAALVAVTAGAASLWLRPAQLRGLVAAGLAALLVQAVTFALLRNARQRMNRFLAVWVGGTLVRFAAVGVVAWVVVRRGEPDLATTLLGLAGYLFGMLLLEPAFLGPDSDSENTRTA